MSAGEPQATTDLTTKCFMTLRSPTENEMQGKDFSHPLEMTMPVISNPPAVLRVNSLRDLSPLLFQRRTRSSRSSELSSSQTLRVLRHLGGEQSNLVVTHFSHESLKNQKNRRQAFAALSFLSLLFFA